MPTVKDYDKYIDPDSLEPAREKENFLKQKRFVKEKRAALAKKKKLYEILQESTTE